MLFFKREKPKKKGRKKGKKERREGEGDRGRRKSGRRGK